MKRPNLHAQGGQLIVEAVLIIVLLMGGVFLVSKIFKDQALVQQLIQGPWKSIAGMLQNGVWGDPTTTQVSHPTGHNRHIVVLGQTP